MFHFLKKTKSVGEKVIFQIGGMHCTSCSLNIDDALEEVEGVISADTSYAKSRCSVLYDTQKVTAAQLQKVIVALGYEVTNNSQ